MKKNKRNTVGSFEDPRYARWSVDVVFEDPLSMAFLHKDGSKLCSNDCIYGMVDTGAEVSE